MYWKINGKFINAKDVNLAITNANNSNKGFQLVNIHTLDNVDSDNENMIAAIDNGMFE